MQVDIQNKSKNTKSARMFQNEFLESFSKVHPGLVLLVYIPVVIYFSYMAVVVDGLSLGMSLLLQLSGIFIWSFAEYTLHRFVFHFQFKGRLGARLHFILHGVHHEYPEDALRLVMPPGMSIPLAFLFYFIFSLIFPALWLKAVFSGFVIGYLGYDMSHFAIHHYNFKYSWFQRLKAHHMKHHYVDSHNGFGVSSGLWDYIFGTHRFNRSSK